jgi:hypothetical protein
MPPEVRTEKPIASPSTLRCLSTLRHTEQHCFQIATEQVSPAGALTRGRECGTEMHPWVSYFHGGLLLLPKESLGLV